MLWAIPAHAEDPAEPVIVVVTTPGGDDSSYQIPLTTTITFDGVQYNSVYATTNSVITFGQPDGTYWTYPTTPSISLYSMDWVVYPGWRADEHLIISASDGGFQVDISARPIWLQGATEPTNINIVAAINTDGTVAISYSIAGPTYEGQTRTGVTLTSGQVVTLEEYGVVQVEEPPVLEPEPVTPTPTPTPEPTVEPTPTPEPTVEPTPTPEPTIPAVVPPTVPEGATLLSEGSSIEVIAPAGQRILSVTAWYGDPADSTRGVEVSSTLTQLASGQTSVTIDSNNMYGDPAPGTPKTLIFVVNYEAIPLPEPTPTPTPEPTVDPTPPVVIPEPVVTPTPEPQPEPEPTPEETIEPTPEPTVEPTIPPTEEPTPEPTPSEEPAQEPEEVKPEPLPEPEQTTATEILGELENIAPEELSGEQVAALLGAAMATFETAEEGSAEYEAALDALAIVAQADDPQLPVELASIPGAEAVLEAFNALGNMGADMSPAARAEAEKIVVAGVVAVNAALSAAMVVNVGTPPVPSAPSAPSGGASASGSGSTARRKE